MKPGAAIDRVMRGVGEDVRGYRELCELLETQFAAAMAHDGPQLEELAARITGRVDALEARRAERVRLVHELFGAHARMATVIESLGGARRQMLDAGWQSLEALVRRCKQLNERNCQLLVTQHDIMRRVLHGDAETYAPA